MKKTFEQLIGEAKNFSLSRAEKEELKKRIFAEIELAEILYQPAQKASFLVFLQRHAIPSAAVAVFLFVFATSAFAEGALPGNFLYSLKTGMNEQVRGWFAVSSNSQAEWEISLAQRRLEEIEKLSDSNQLTLKVKEEVNGRIDIHTEKAKQNIAETEDREAEKEGNSADAARSFGSESETAVLLNMAQEGVSSSASIAVESQFYTKDDASKYLEEAESQLRTLDKKVKKISRDSSKSRIKARLNFIAAERVFVEGKISFSNEDFDSAVVSFKEAINSSSDLSKQLDINFSENTEPKKEPSDSSANIRSKNLIEFGEDRLVASTSIEASLRQESDDGSNSGTDDGTSGEVRGTNSESGSISDERENTEERDEQTSDGGQDKNGIKIEIQGSVEGSI
jgi:hypothetical protein